MRIKIKDSVRFKTMSLIQRLESWRDITGISHGSTWCISSATLLPGGCETIPSFPWSDKSSLITVVTGKRYVTSAGTKMNAAAPAFVPGGLEHTVHV
jgi:hypothetical protein